MVVDRCEREVGSCTALGEAQATLPYPKLVEDDSVQVMLQTVSKKKDRETAIRLATYREAVACMPLALPPQIFNPHQFIGQLLIHSDSELAASTSRMLQTLMTHQPVHR